MTSSSDSDAGALSDQSEGELRSASHSPSPERERERRPRELTKPVSNSSSCLSRYYRERFGSHSPEDYLNLRFSRMDEKLSKEEIKSILENELKKLAPFEVKVVRDPESEDRLAYVNFRRNNCAKTVRRALIPQLQAKLGENVLIDPAGVLRDQEGKFIPDRFNRAQMTTELDHRGSGSSGPSHPHRSFSNLNQDASMATRTLFVGNLPGNVRFNELMRIFGEYGTIEDIDIKLVNDGVAAYSFIVFHSLDSAIDALHNLHNKPIRPGTTRCQIGYGKSQVSQRLWVGRLGAWTTREMLSKEFDRYGVVERVDYKTGDHHAYIRFADTNNAKDACLAMKNFALDGRHRIVVDYAKERGGPPRGERPEPPPFKRKPPSPLAEEPRRKRAPTPEPERNSDGIMKYDELAEKFVSTWKGFLCLKKTEFNIKLHRVLGKEHLVQDLMRDDNGCSFKLKVDQRLPRDAAFLTKMSNVDKDNLVFLIGAETSLSFTPFIQYMDEKKAVGVASLPQAQVYVLPYCALTSKVIKQYIPHIQLITSDSNFLLIVLHAL